MKINKQELKYLGLATLFSFIVFAIIIPFLLKNGEENRNPYLDFIIFNIGIFFFLQIFLKGFVSEKKFNFKTSFGILFLFISMDILAPPMMVSLQGELLTGAVLSGSASDYIVGDILHRIGLVGFPVYILTYTLFPFLLLFVSSLLLKNLLEEI